MTASGDQTIALWDTATAQRVGTFRGHEGSIKSVCPWGACHDVCASGARDGRLCLWDSRVVSRTSDTDMHVFAPVIRIKVRCRHPLL